MLGLTLWFVVALGVLATVLLDAAAAFGRASVTAAANHAVAPAAHDAIADYQNRLQSAIAAVLAAPSPAPLGDVLPAVDYAAAVATIPNPLAAQLSSDAALTPTFTIAYRVVPTTLVAPTCVPGATTTGTDAIGWLQCANAVQESRVSLHVTVDVRDAAATQTLAHRDEYVTLRLFAEPPYSALVGSKDVAADDPAASDALAVPAHEGDIGGDTVSGESPAPGAGLPAGGTLIHVRYECHDGAGHCANAAPPDPDAALRSDASWSNGNAPEP